MFKLGLKLLISLILLTSLRAEGQNVATTPQNVVVPVKDYLKPQILSAINRDNQSAPAKNSANAGLFSTPRSKSSSTARDLFACAIALDASCIVDRAEDIVDNANSELLQQADIEARGFARKKEETPSNLLSAIVTMFMELPDLLREGFNALMRQGKLEVRAAEPESEEESSEEEEESTEDDDDEEETSEEEDDDDESEDESEDASKDEASKEVKQESEAIGSEDGIEAKVDGSWNYNYRKRCPKRGGCMQQSNNGGSSGNDVSGDGYDELNYSDGSDGRKHGGEGDYGRGKKKKKKKAIVKLLLLGLVLKAKITLLLKMLAAKLQIKFLLIALANLLINLARFWWDLKKGHGEQPQKVIYYEHAQHQHHYDGGEDWHGSSPGGGSSGGGGGYWARAYDSEEDKKAAQDIAYSKYAPHGTTYSRIDDKPNISWNPSVKSYL